MTILYNLGGKALFGLCLLISIFLPVSMWMWIVIVLLLSLYFLRPKKKDDIIVLQKPDFKKDLLYIVQFPVSPIIRTISPFALKLETYLRLKRVPYEPIYCLKFSKKGQIPYIELNGEQIADSNIIINTLEKRGIAEKDVLTTEQMASNHLATITMENHTSIAGFHWRYGFNMPEFYEKLCKPFYGESRAMKFFEYLQPYIMVLKTKLHGIGRHSLDEVAEFSFQDLNAISVLLGDKPFFNGNSPTIIDCTMFGHLVQFVYMPMDIPQKKYIKEKVPNLADFVDRMRNKFWPDWEAMCHEKCMEGKRPIVKKEP